MEHTIGWLTEEWNNQASAALSGMTGLAVTATAAIPEDLGDSLEPGESCWRATLSAGADAHIYLRAIESAWRALGEAVLESAGMSDADEETIRSTYLEIAQQSVSGVAQLIGRRLKKEVTVESSEEIQTPPPVEWQHVSFNMEGRPGVLMAVGYSPALLTLVDPKAHRTTSAPTPVQTLAPAPNVLPSAPSKTIGLLMEVDLPVAVSFGRAQMRLKDVIKLTTGSIVGLNRTITEPVEIIVNNCVIARGEVVVVEGNYGVRIQQIVSQQERLRTLF